LWCLLLLLRLRLTGSQLPACTRCSRATFVAVGVNESHSEFVSLPSGS
jgi:hypothetical protein